MKVIKLKVWKRFAGCVSAIAATAMLAACGGGGGSAATAGGAAVTSSGAIQQFGSILVNGVKYQTAGATLHLRDDKTDRVLQNETEIQGLLGKGMVVTVKGTVDDSGSNGVAREIEFRHQMEGEITGKGADFLVVLGQTIVVDDSASATLATLAVGDKVGISALPDDKGGLRATFLEKKADNLAEFEAKGFVSNLSGNTFTLLLSPDAASGIPVTLGAGVTLPAGVTDGSFVEVRTLSVGGVITATKVEVEDQLKAGENEKEEFEGFVSSVTGSDFVINGQNVQTSSSTVFVGGQLADLTVGTKVEVEGRISGGILVASKVVFKENVRIDAVVEAVDAASGQVTLLGKNILVKSGTVFNGIGGAALDLSGIAVGQELAVRGVLAANGTDLVATRIDEKAASVDAASFRPILRGPASAKDATAGTVTIAGIVIDLSGSELRGPNEAVLTSANFFNAITLNTTVVKVVWNAPFTTTAAAVGRAEVEK